MSVFKNQLLFHRVVAFLSGTSTPTFGQSAAPGPIPFGTPGTPVQVQGFNSVPFGKLSRLCINILGFIAC